MCRKLCHMRAVAPTTLQLLRATRTADIQRARSMRRSPRKKNPAFHRRDIVPPDGVLDSQPSQRPALAGAPKCLEAHHLSARVCRAPLGKDIRTYVCVCGCRMGAEKTSSSAPTRSVVRVPSSERGCSSGRYRARTGVFDVSGGSSTAPHTATMAFRIMSRSRTSRAGFDLWNATSVRARSVMRWEYLVESAVLCLLCGSVTYTQYTLGTAS